MPKPDISELKFGDIVRVGYGFTDFDAKVIAVDDDGVRVRLLWNDPTMAEEDIDPIYLTYTQDELLDVKKAS